MQFYIGRKFFFIFIHVADISYMMVGIHEVANYQTAINNKYQDKYSSINYPYVMYYYLLLHYQAICG